MRVGFVGEKFRSVSEDDQLISNFEGCCYLGKDRNAEFTERCRGKQTGLGIKNPFE